MDCRTALSLLESVRPDTDDLSSPELVDAAEHLARCAKCEAIFLKRQASDRKIGDLMRNVPVPAHLEESLLRSVEAAAGRERVHIPSPVAMTRTSSPARNRGARIRFVAAACVILLLVLGGWGVVLLTGPATTLPELFQELADVGRWSALPEFHGDQQLLSLPDSSWESGLVWSQEPPRGLPRAAEAHLAALRSFEAPVSRHDRLSGILLVMFRSSIASPPEESSGMPSAPVDYVEIAGRQYTVVAWSSGDYLYVCGVEGGADALEQLQRALELPPA
ncbi:MAG: hypothetical protein AB7O26_10260 [Planctomycetaceae bacterium]